MEDTQYMNRTLDELYSELDSKKQEMNKLKKNVYDIESDIVGIKEAIRSKTSNTPNTHVKKFGSE